MLNIIIKHFFIYICFFYIYYHLINQKNKSHNFYLITFFYSFFLSFLTCFLRFFYPSLTNVLPIILLWISLGIYFSNPKLSFMATIISFSNTFFIFSILLHSTNLFTFNNSNFIRMYRNIFYFATI